MVRVARVSAVNTSPLAVSITQGGSILSKFDMFSFFGDMWRVAAVSIKMASENDDFVSLAIAA